MDKCIVILAAGEGKRMKTDLPKMLHKVCGKEIINHVIDTIRLSGIDNINLVVGKNAEQVKAGTSDKDITYSLQDTPLGTGHAVMCAKDFLKDKKGNVAIFVGDGPLITKEMVEHLFRFHEDGKYAATILTSTLKDPAKYGRIVRDSQGTVEKIVEFKDCSEDEVKINEINSGMYCFNIEALLNTLGNLNNNNAQGEYYLTDVIEILKKQNLSVGALTVPVEEITAVNSRVELAVAEQIMKTRINKYHMENGVTIIDPNNTYIGADVTIGQDTIIYPGNVIEGKTIIKDSCTLYPNNRLKDSVIEKGVTLQSSVILESSIGENTTVGPFAYIRLNSVIGNNVRIGDFVEVKKSTIGDGTKASHLTYIGDAEVGSQCNFGCGTVIVNYDGQTKNKTVIGDHVFIGCNANIVSPVELKDNSYIAAGSTVTKEVPEGNLAIARARQTNIADWVEKKGLKK